MTTLKIRKVGNSLGTILPAELLSELKVKEGDSLYVVKDAAGGVRLTAYDPDLEAAMEAGDSLMRRYRNAMRELAK
jgi:putative addiction module antidote